MDDPDSPRHREFISEAITPVEGSFDTASMATGEPGLPLRFRWRGTEYEVARVLERWKSTGPCKHGSGEQYVRKHWFRIVTTDGNEMELYFDRQSRTKDVKQRWWLATIMENAGPRLAVVSYPTLADADSRWIESIRVEHDPRAGVLAAHFTLAFPVALPPDGLVEEIAAAVDSSRPIPFVIRQARAVRDVVAGGSRVYLVPEEGAREIAVLHDRLYGGVLRPHLRADIPFEPHITVGASDSLERCEDIVEKIRAACVCVVGRLETVELVEIASGSLRTAGRFALRDE